MGSLTYRPEIDGLRAVAVLPVVLFHLDPELVPGGFTGVDVFFVISGFLITSILLREQDRGGISLRAFWMRRVRRLFPALAAMLLATTLAGYFLLYGEEWQSLGRQLGAVLLLVANVHLWKETGDYWSTAAETLPLLHTWSLAVEEQFYLLYPLVVLAFSRSRKLLAPMLLAGALGSLAWCLVQTAASPAAAFYLLPARAWELLAGCLLAVWMHSGPTPRTHGHPAFATLGLGLVLLSCFVIEGGDAFPGARALLPVGGAALVIAFGGKGGGPVHALLASAPLVYIGKRSYSLYLWHWPLIVLWRLHTQADPGTLPNMLLLGLGSMALASLSYRFVETPFRRPGYPLLSGKGTTLVTGFACLTLCALLLRAGQPPPRSSPRIAAPSFTARFYDAGRDDAWQRGGILHGPEPPTIAVIGSSHALMYGATLTAIAQDQKQGIAFLCRGNVFGRFHTEGDDAIFRDEIADERAAFDKARLTALERWRPAEVVWIGRWENQLEVLGVEAFEETIGASLELLLARAGRITLVTQPPFCLERPGSPVRLVDARLRSGAPPVGREDPARTTLRDQANEALRQLARKSPRIQLVEAADLFELGKGNVRLLSADGRELLYHDANHLSDQGAALVAPRLAKALTRPQ